MKRRLDATFGRAPPPFADIELQADFAKYLCVLVSGFFENAIAALLIDYAAGRSAPEVASFVERGLERWTNPNVEKVIALLGSFSADWRSKAGAFLVDERKASVNSLVALRHQIAHGESVGTSLSQVRSHYRTIAEVVDFVADLVDPLPSP
ncbi:MAG: HEPN domain-containing protein [Sinimarinibacterium flocculans]|uniref:HEPN domain-containing protein n=1 Tax=Sinimarinibacterium flocculans TaxID=985250 RepID=UPI003C55E192